MRTRRRFYWPALTVLTVLFTLTAAGIAQAATIQTDLFIYQNGDTVTVTGVDFGPTETVDLVTADPNAAIVDQGTAATDANGAFSYQFVLNATVPGIYEVTATGEASGLSATTTFDPPSFGLTFTSSGISPSSVNYSDNVTFSGNFKCTDNAGVPANKCLASYSGID